MSDALLHSDLVGMPKPAPTTLGKRRWRLWVLFTELGLIGVGLASLYWPILGVSNVVYHGPADWESEVRSLAGIPSDGNLLHFVPADAQSRIATRFSGRANTQVRIDLPNAIAITMIPHVPRLWTDGDIGVTAAGRLLTEPITHPEAPHWRPGIDWEENRTLAERASLAAGFWDELAASDSRFALVTRELTNDDTYGWTITAADGKTRIAFGNSAIESRAHAVARLLDQGDTLLSEPYFIDARFDGRLLLSVIPKIEPDTTAADSSAAVVAADPPAVPKKLNPATRRTAKGRA